MAYHLRRYSPSLGEGGGSGGSVRLSGDTVPSASKQRKQEVELGNSTLPKAHPSSDLFPP